jgi:hypothetical protein
VHGKSSADYPVPTRCAFLGDDSSCLVHQARPFACRNHHSLEVERCKRSFETGVIGEVLVDIRMKQVASLVHGGLHLDLLGAGFDVLLYELQEAAHIALTDPRAGKKWLSGEDVFSSARNRE